METVAFTFFAVPALAATVAGYLVADWRLAGALAAGGFGLIFVLIPLGTPYVFALPVISGIAVSTAALTPFLGLVSDPTVWGRMSVALVATLIASGLLFAVVSGGR